MSKLDELAGKRDQILLAEIGALIHDLGKLSKEFVFAKAVNGQGDDVHHLFLQRYPPQVPGYLKGHSSKQNRVETALKYLGAVDTDQVRALHAYLEAEYEANPRLDLGGALRVYGKKNPTAHELIAQTEAVVEEYKKLSSELALAEMVAQVPSDFLPGALIDLLNVLTLPAYSPSIGLPLFPETVIGELIEGHHAPPSKRRVKKSEYLSILRARPGVDGVDSGVDKQGKELVEGKQPLGKTLIATAFGHEPESLRIKIDELKKVRHDYANDLALILQRIQTERASLTADHTLPSEFWQEVLYDGWQTEDRYSVKGLRELTEAAFRQALGETRRAANDVTLWDHSYSVASLYKAALAKVLLEGEWTKPAQIKWRILRVSFDGPGFWGQAHHVTDMSGRQQAVEEALDRVRETLEVTYPLGNEVYRDENGSAFLMPNLGDVHRELEAAVRGLVTNAVGLTDLTGELVPKCHWYLEPVREGMTRAFGTTLRKAPRPLTGDPHRMDGWWKDSPPREICTVCGVRPVGYRPKRAQIPGWVTSDKAEKRHICCVCLHRRGRRAETWLTKEDHTTIWADEVVDVNSRFALIVGRFDLTQWLNGTLVRTMLVAPGKSKNPSPARIRRVWETTQRFWERVQAEEIPGALGKPRSRLVITPRNKGRLADSDPKKGLGWYHTYKLQVGGSFISVVWDPKGRNLILTEYLRDLGRRLGLPEGAWKDGDIVGALQSWFKEHASGNPWPIFETSGYLSPAAKTGYAIEVECVHSDDSQYTPHIPLLTEPALFMALIPANKAMDVVGAIKEKYEREMSKVRDRLPLHLGVVIAPRRTPLRAVLEAGRAMLERGGRGEGPGARGWEEWRAGKKTLHIKTVGDTREESKEVVEQVDLTLSRNERQIAWTIPTVMGDGETPDRWYPHLLKRPLAPGEEPDVTADLVHVRDMVEGQTVYIVPSTFDFEFLDTTARRFEIAYQTSKVSETSEVSKVSRLSRPTRPYLLEEIGDLQSVWKLISKRLTTSQWMALDGLIEQKRREWNEPRGASDRYSDTFERFVKDTLCNAKWRWKENEKVKKDWKRLDEREQALLERAALRGVLNDVINLYHEAMKRSEEE